MWSSQINAVHRTAFASSFRTRLHALQGTVVTLWKVRALIHSLTSHSSWLLGILTTCTHMHVYGSHIEKGMENSGRNSKTASGFARTWALVRLSDTESDPPCDFFLVLDGSYLAQHEQMLEGFAPSRRLLSYDRRDRAVTLRLPAELGQQSHVKLCCKSAQVPTRRPMRHGAPMRQGIFTLCMLI
jgi:hypothetical protein